MRIDLATASPDTFEPFVGQEFKALAHGTEVPLVLEGIKIFDRSGVRDAVVRIDGVELPPRQAFGLTFIGPLEPELEHETFVLTHPELEDMAIFLALFRREEGAACYEAVFN